MADRPPIYGLMAEFEEPDDLVAATRQVVAAGYREVDAYTPFPVEGLYEVMERRGTRLPLIVLAGGILGGVGGFAMQYYASVIDYAINVGGRPYNSWPAFIPITFELTILGAALAAILGMLALNGLPMPYHPVFNVPRFALASRDRFFLCIEADDPQFDRQETEQFLQSLNPLEVSEVDW